MLDVLEPEYLVKNEVWVCRFMQSTATVLCWLITYTFRLENPVEAIATRKSTGVTPLHAKEKTTCILKGDLLFIGFPDGLQKPETWSARKRAVCPWYGELEGSRQLQEQVAEEVMEELRTELFKPEAKPPEPNDDFDADRYLDSAELAEDLGNMCKRVQKRINAFEALEKKSVERRSAFGAELARIR